MISIKNTMNEEGCKTMQSIASAQMKIRRVAVLTISDSCFSGLAEDKSGPAIEMFLASCTYFFSEVVDRKCVPDDKNQIQEVLINLCDALQVDLVLTTGGTGLSSRDVTAEAVREIINREVPGISLIMLIESMKVTQFAMLSRPVCGCRNGTLIITLPGSSKAVTECLGFVAPVFNHAIDLLRDSKNEVASTHLEVQKLAATEGLTHIPHGTDYQELLTAGHEINEQKDIHSCAVSELVSQVDISKVARRDRKSPYPLISVKEAQTLILENAFCMPASELLFSEIVGFALIDNVYACEALPPFPASIKDGYAVVSSDGEGQREVIGQSWAGIEPQLREVRKGACMRINTGAPVPPGADAVVQVEDTELLEATYDGTEELRIRILKAPKKGQEIRMPGSDISKGEKLFDAGTVIGPAEVGIMATAGVFKVSVQRKPVVSILSTGNELQEPGLSPLKEGYIYDSNKATLLALLHQYSVPCIDAGIARDKQTDLLRAICNALGKSDILVTSGGVSMGEKDLLRPVLITDLKAKIHFAQVFMKPGKPTTFATCTFKGKPKLILGLPGNPVSAIVTAHLYLLPLCRKMSGIRDYHNTVIKVKLDSEIKLDPRPEYHRATLSWSQDDDFPRAHSTGNQISSRLLSVSSAQALLQLPPSSAQVKSLPAGTLVEAIRIF